MLFRFLRVNNCGFSYWPLAVCRLVSPFPMRAFVPFDNAIEVQGERGGKLAWPSLSRSPQSPLLLQCNGKITAI